jgi:arylsulfatase A-like enzyme
VLITIDTLRPDRLGAYGHTNHTPALDRLASEGTFFRTAYCDMPWTTGSMSSVMTGQYSSSHGVNLPSMKLKPEAVTMAEILGSKGYRTGAIVGSFPLDSVYGLDQGFETYDDEFSMPMIAVTGEKTVHVPVQDPNEEGFVLRKFKNDAYRPDEGVTDAAIHWMRGHSTRGSWVERLKNKISGDPYFLWIHYFGPHEKLKGDVGILQQEPDIVKAYDGDVEKSDKAVGRLFDEMRSLGMLDGALVIVHADHGQNLGEFGVIGHGLRVDEATVRIPMILRYPTRIAPGVVREDVAHNIDILPTVLDVTGIGEVPGLAGRSLLPTAEDPRGEKVPAEKQVAYFATNLTTILLQPLLVPGYWSVLGPVKRSGMRTLEWRFVDDQVVGECSHGGNATRGPFGEWKLPDGKPLEREKCESIRVGYLYPVSVLGDKQPNVVKDFPVVEKELRTKLDVHASHRSPLASPLELSPEQEEKLKSLGYVTE